jgi:hypothetical protein
VEHTIGLLKGTFQSLKEIRVQLINIKRHKIIIMWARVCLILHNLIIRIEGDNFDQEWRESLSRAGLARDDAGVDADRDDGPEEGLEQARRRLETPGQRFRLRIMEDLFNNTSRLVERRP